jgi:transposase-like protein
MENDTLQKSAVNNQPEPNQEQPGREADSGNMPLIKEFNNILGIHIEQLLGTRYGIDELELNLFSVSCVVLLATRETEIETFPALPPQRYTVSALIEELAEMSIEPESEINNVIDEMIKKNYLKITDERIFCNKPMISMAQLFDRIFPNMPGLNLVAYLGQMIDEVTAGRKSQEDASKQFHQMLDIQGVSVNEAAAKSASVKKRFSHLRLGDETSAPRKEKRPVVIPVKPVNIFSQLKRDKVIKPSSMIKGIQQQPMAVSPFETQDISAPVSLKMDQGAVTDGLAVTGSDTKDINPSQDISQEPHEDGREIQGAISENFEPPDDREIEDRILEFEAQLGLKCPLCGTGSIKTSETAKGKTYYHCSSSGCNFISWGKPYYIDCPKCASNFLIEVTDSSGKSFLKCPKATCSHWQKFPWEMSEPDADDTVTDPVTGDVVAPKRLVRRKRRVVRRKR